MTSKRSAEMTFEDTARRILKAGPMPKSTAKPQGKKASKVAK